MDTPISKRIKRLRTVKREKFPGYSLVPKTSGKITDGIWMREDGQAIVVSFAWEGDLHFKPLTQREMNK